MTKKHSRTEADLYQDALEWVASEDAPGNTPPGMSDADAEDIIGSQLTACLVSDVFGRPITEVARIVLAIRKLPVKQGAA